MERPLTTELIGWLIMFVSLPMLFIGHLPSVYAAVHWVGDSSAYVGLAGLLIATVGQFNWSLRRIRSHYRALRGKG